MDGKIVISADASQVRSETQKASDAVRGFGSTAADQTDKASDGLDHLNLSTAGARRELIVLAHEMSQGNWKRFGGSLLVLAERMDAMSLIFSATGAAIGATVGIMAAFAAAAYKGTEESKAFAAATQLTGNYAGITEGQYNQMARTLAQSADTGIGQARDALMQLVASGRYSSQMLNTVGTAALAFARLSGQSSSDVIKDFDNMKDGVAKWAAEHNQQYHFLTAAQYSHIDALEKEGNTQEAMLATMEAFNDHLKSQTENVGLLESAWHAARTAMSDFWDDMKSIGRDKTLDDKIAAAKQELAELNSGNRVSEDPNAKARLEAEIAQLQARKDLQEMDVKSAALSDQLHAKAIRAIQDDDALTKSMRTRAQEADDEVKRYLANQAAITAAGMTPDSAEQQAAMIAAIRAKYAEKPHGNAQMHQWEAELEELKLAEQEKAQEEGRFYEASKQEEQKYWQDKLALTTTGSKENIAVRKKIAELGLGIMKDQYDADQAGLKLGIEASKNAYDARLIYMQKYVDNARSMYGEDSAQYKNALKEQEVMRREHDAQMRQMDQIRIADERSNAQAVIDEQQRVAQMDYEIGLITRSQLLQIERGYLAEKERLELQAADDEIKLYQKDTVEYEKALAKKKNIERKYAGLLSQNGNAQTIEQRKPETTVFGSMKSSLSTDLASMLTAAQSFQQSMANIARSVGQTMVEEMVTKPFAQWVAGWVRKLAMNLGFLGTENAQQAASAATGTGIAAASASAQIATNAAVAGSGAAASQASIPYIGPILAVAAMAAIFAAVSGMGRNVKSAAGGFNIPPGMNPMTQLHEEEMVLPKHIANPLRALISSGGGSGGGGNTIHYHDNSGRLTPPEIRRNAKIIADALRDYARKQ